MTFALQSNTESRLWFLTQLCPLISHTMPCHAQATPKPHPSHTQATHKPHTSHTKATQKPHKSHKQATQKPHTSHSRATHEPLASHTNARHKRHKNTHQLGKNDQTIQNGPFQNKPKPNQPELTTKTITNSKVGIASQKTGRDEGGEGGLNPKP
jgi:hypothetical protein